MSTTINEDLDKIIKMLDEMNRKLERLEQLANAQNDPFVYPGDVNPQPDYHSTVTT